MADNQDKQSKPGNKTGELLLNLLGTLGGIAGPLLTGQNIDLGTPFKLGAAYLTDRRTKQDIAKALAATPHTQGILQDAEQILSDPNINLPNVLQGMAVQNSINSLSRPVQMTPQSTQPSLGVDPQLGNIPPELTAQAYIPAMLGIQGGQGEQLPGMGGMTEGGGGMYDPIALIENLVKFGQPEKALGLLPHAIGRQPNSMDTIMKALGMENLLFNAATRETPEQKSQRKLAEVSATSDIIVNRQLGYLSARNAAAQQMKLETPSENFKKAIDSHSKAIGLLSSMLDTVNSGGMPSLAARLASGDEVASGFAQWAELATSRDIQMSRDINQLVMAVVKQQTGVQYGFRELQWVKATQPSKWDTEETFRNGISMALNNALFNKYNMIITRAQRAGNIDLAYREEGINGKPITEEQVRAYDILCKQLGERATRGVSDARVFADPQNQKLLDTLGMQLLDRPTKY